MIIHKLEIRTNFGKNLKRKFFKKIFHRGSDPIGPLLGTSLGPGHQKPFLVKYVLINIVNNLINLPDHVTILTFADLILNVNLLTDNEDESCETIQQETIQNII